MGQDIPVIVMGGSVEEVEALNTCGFLAVLPLLPYPVSLGAGDGQRFHLPEYRACLGTTIACNQILYESLT